MTPFKHVLKRLNALALMVCSCLLVVGLYSPAFGNALAKLGSATPDLQPTTSTGLTLGQTIDANLQAAESVLLAQGADTRAMKAYVAVMSDANVVPNAPMTNARGAVGAALVGDRLVVRASFGALTSALRDYATDPVDPPNPNITSAFHIHRGMPTENGPFQYALNVTLDESGLGGSAAGEYTLTPEQLTALDNMMLYVDLHTTRNRGGELRAVLMPY